MTAKPGGAVGGFLTALRPRGTRSEMRALAAELGRVLRRRIDTPLDMRELAQALCEEMSRRRGGRPVQLRFERFPDEIEVTGLWMEFNDFDLVIVEERAETVQQLVILGHELWHMKEGHRDHHVDGATAVARAALSDRSALRDPGARGPFRQEVARTVAARNGSRQADEAQAEAFGLHLASVFRSWVTGPGDSTPVDPVGRAIETSLGYRRPQD
ncbi:toxin-antitoxin system, toxin component [Streptomyces sp. NPDC054766]|uniref:toxin-antitoxin system, toxin component n=1 Tax=Streptomyces rhizosphaerihabitans TaxID=1266770 RepID=UPI0021BFC220|nr:toxin-antitoxin system, toxin component [Streptomyces rhizosphaerihabitans]MCT9004113.1 toxin-antitoxin system, toxin component [Streptomyces rhizosphaerihabitans]